MSRRASEEVRAELRTRPVRERARAFLEEAMALAEKYDLLTTTEVNGGPEVCVMTLSNDRVTVYVKWPLVDGERRSLKDPPKPQSEVADGQVAENREPGDKAR
jgi:hypothetical protein